MHIIHERPLDSYVSNSGALLALEAVSCRLLAGKVPVRLKSKVSLHTGEARYKANNGNIKLLQNVCGGLRECLRF